MSFNTIYVNGCSFSCGGGFNWDSVKQSYKDRLNIEITNPFDFAYPTIVSNYFKSKIVNESIPGGSTNRLIRKTYEYIFKNLNNINETLFILELPPQWRDEFYSNILNRELNITHGLINHPDTDLTERANGNPKDDVDKFYNEFINYFNNFLNLEFEEKKTTNNLIGLISFIKSKNLKYVIIDGFMFKHNLEINKLNANEYQFCKFDDNYMMHSWFSENKLTISNELGIDIDGHAGIEGNKKIAEIIINYIKNYIK